VKDVLSFPQKVLIEGLYDGFQTAFSDHLLDHLMECVDGNRRGCPLDRDFARQCLDELMAKDCIKRDSEDATRPIWK
jgi:hypothetical protein